MVNHFLFCAACSKSIEQTRHHIELLQEPHDDSHWYFGAFLAETGELIGEGGLPDIDGR